MSSQETEDFSRTIAAGQDVECYRHNGWDFPIWYLSHIERYTTLGMLVDGQVSIRWGWNSMQQTLR